MEAVQRFLRHGFLSYKALFGWLDPKVYIFVMVLSPLSQLIFFSTLVNFVYKGENLLGYVAANALLLCVLNSVFGIMSVITSDRWMGTLPLDIATPYNKASLFLSRSIAHVLNGLVTAAIGLMFGVLIFQLTISVKEGLVLLVIWLFSIFTATGLGLILGTFCLWSPSMHLWSNLLASLLLLLSGANYPFSRMPEWLQFLGQFTPLTRGVQLTKDILNDGNYANVVSLLGEEILLGIAFFAISFLLLKFAEYQSRSK